MKSYVRIVGLVVMFFAATQTLFAEDPADANRQALEDCLRKIAARAQVSFHTPSADGGLGGSFAHSVLSYFLSWPVNAYGSFCLFSPTATSIAFCAVGVEKGRDGTNPIEMEIVVYSDSVSVWHNN